MEEMPYKWMENTTGRCRKISVVNKIQRKSLVI